jgi:hypothetical protein
MCSGAGDTTQLVPGFPIRTPWDHSSVDSSPRPIAASHVLHRLLVPRHPPYALSNLTTKMLASTVQFSTNATQPTPHPTPTPHTPPRNNPGQQHATQFAGQASGPRILRPKTQPPPQQPKPPGRNGCFFRTQQGVPPGDAPRDRHHQPHPHPPPHPTPPNRGPGSTTDIDHNDRHKRGPLPAAACQCLRHRAPHPHQQPRARAPEPPSRPGAP